MSPFRIPGPPIVGMNDLFEGQAPEGRPRSQLGTTIRLVTVQRNPSLVAPGGHTKEGHANAKAASINVLRAGKNALDAAKKATTSVKQYSTAVKLGFHSPLVPLQPVGVRDNGMVVLGAATKGPLTPAQTAAVQKHVADVAKSAAATRRLEGLAKKAKAIGNQAVDASKKTTQAIATALQPKWRSSRTHTGIGHLSGSLVGGHAAQLLEDYYTAIGATPDSNNPGFLTDGSPDPAFADPNAHPGAGATSPQDQSTPSTDDDGAGPVTGPDGTVLYDPATDPAIVTVPTRGGTLSSDDAQVSWQHVPEDGIPYDGSRGLPANAIGSWNVFYGNGPKSADGLWGTPGFLRGVGDFGNIFWFYNDGGDNKFHGAPDQYQTQAKTGAPEADAVSANSLQRGWGALVGNPGGALSNLQYAILDKVWFWQGANAPTWATAETDSKISAANKKTVQANRTAALLHLAQLQKDALAQQEAKSKQAAVNALAQSAADTQANITQQQVQGQQAQLDVQKQKAELDASKALAQNEAQAQHALVTKADIWNQWAAKNPDQAVAQMQQDGGQGYDSGEEGGGYEDGGEDDGTGEESADNGSVDVGGGPGDAALQIFNPAYGLFRLFGGQSLTNEGVPEASYGDIKQTSGYRHMQAQAADSLARGISADSQRQDALRALAAIRAAPFESDASIPVSVPSFSLGSEGFW